MALGLCECKLLVCADPFEHETHRDSLEDCGLEAL